MSNHVVLSGDDHRDLRVHAGSSGALGDAVMTALTVPYEFRRVQHDFPILFRRDPASGSFVALALMGFENGENLFLDDDRWTAGYKPLSLSIQPFLIGRPAEAGGDAQVHIDMAHPRIASSGDGVRLFDDQGQPSPYLEQVSAMLGELDAGYRASGDFFAALQRYDLLEPFSLDIELRDGSQHRMVGYHLIDEDKVRRLEDGAVAELHRDGHLMPLFMALASLSNLPGLIERKNRRNGDG